MAASKNRRRGKIPTWPEPKKWAKRDYTKIIFESSAYLWLTASIRRELTLAPVPGQEKSCTSIYSALIRYLDVGDRAVSNRRPSDRHMVHLTADWISQRS